MKQKTKSAAALAAACLLAVSLAGCGIINKPGSTQNAPAATEPTAASDAFGQESVWMVYDDDQIGKDVAIERILAFDGSGNVTAYQCDGATFADLNGLSDKEIIDFAKQQDKAVFDAAKQSAIDSNAETIEAWQQCYDILKAEADAGTYDSMNYYGAYGIEAMPEEERAGAIEEFQATLENTKNSLDAANEGQAFNEAAKYQEPQPQPYTLALETDGSGNVASGEEIRFAAPRLNFYQLSIVDTSDLENPETRFRVLIDYGWHNDAEIPETAFGTSEETVELSSPIYSTTSIVYDTTFGGYQGLATVVEDATTEYTWDTVDTEGIEID